MASQKFRVSVLLVLALGAISPQAAAVGLQFSVGADYSTGDFGGTTPTDVFVVPVTARLRWGNWSLRAAVPYVTVRGPADVTVVVGEDGGSAPESEEEDADDSSDLPEDAEAPPTTGSSGFANNRSVSGIGDASLSLAYSFSDIGGSPIYLDVTARTKLATGSASKGLGVGTTDYAALTEVGWLGESYGLYAGGGRRFLGSSSRVQRQDGWQWTAGSWLDATPSIEIGAAYRGREASVGNGTDASEVEANVALRFAKAWRLVLYAGAGLSDGSPDTLGGLTLSWNVSRGRR